MYAKHSMSLSSTSSQNVQFAAPAEAAFEMNRSLYVVWSLSIPLPEPLRNGKFRVRVVAAAAFFLPSFFSQSPWKPRPVSKPLEMRLSFPFAQDGVFTGPPTHTLILKGSLYLLWGEIILSSRKAVECT